jgi:hypothetical protein
MGLQGVGSWSASACARKGSLRKQRPLKPSHAAAALASTWLAARLHARAAAAASSAGSSAELLLAPASSR